ncbi:MAG: synthase subunit gamma [Caulobacteraceae bacterium]|nr:synthase subunit gamma [Caulobacteraceae bacterium]
MASLKDMRSQIASVKATQKITKAIQMVAAAKLRRSQEAAESARPYASRMAAVIANLAAGVSGDGAPKLLVGTGRDQKQLLIIATADRGLAGGFNTGIVRAAKARIEELTAAGKDVRVITLGKKAFAPLKRPLGDKIIATYIAGNKPSLDVAKEVAQRVSDMFEAGEVDVVTLFYSRYKSVVQQIPTAKQLVPASATEGAPVIDLKGAGYEYEPDAEGILEELLPRNITTQIFAAMLENQAGFFAAQMSAMDNATRNAGDRITALTVTYNRTRQAQITKELIEIISGAEAL